MASLRIINIPNETSNAQGERESKEKAKVDIQRMILFDEEKDYNIDYVDQDYLFKKPANRKTKKGFVSKNELRIDNRRQNEILEESNNKNENLENALEKAKKVNAANKLHLKEMAKTIKNYEQQIIALQKKCIETKEELKNRENTYLETLAKKEMEVKSSQRGQSKSGSTDAFEESDVKKENSELKTLIKRLKSRAGKNIKIAEKDKVIIEKDKQIVKLRGYNKKLRTNLKMISDYYIKQEHDKVKELGMRQSKETAIKNIKEISQLEMEEDLDYTAKEFPFINVGTNNVKYEVDEMTSNFDKFEAEQMTEHNLKRERKNDDHDINTDFKRLKTEDTSVMDNADKEDHIASNINNSLHVAGGFIKLKRKRESDDHDINTDFKRVKTEDISVSDLYNSTKNLNPSQVQNVITSLSYKKGLELKQEICTEYLDTQREGGKGVRVKKDLFIEPKAPSMYNIGFYQRAKNIIQKLSLPYLLNARVPSDGNCFYYALLQGLINKETGIRNDCDVLYLKQRIINHMKNNAKNIICENTGNNKCPNNCRDGYAHIKYLSGDAIWADEFIIQAASELFSVNIILVDTVGKASKYAWINTDDNNQNIYIFYFPKLHFQGLIPDKGTGGQ